jgi:opacity protein-like surface antigen
MLAAVRYSNAPFNRALSKASSTIGRKAVLAGAVAAMFGVSGSPSAMAQNCGALNLTGPGGAVTNTLGPIATGLSGGLAVSAAVSAANTAFLTQSTAFASAPGNPKPNQEGGGVWVRHVGGDLTLNTSTQIGAVNVINPVFGGVTPGTYTGSTSCNSQFRQTFAGFQLGQDIARLNAGGWNLHLGTTAGYLETQGSIVGGNVAGMPFNSTTQAPFVGTYGVATYGTFFIDGLIRYDYFETNLNSPSANLFNQKLDAHGFTAAASTGYSWKVPNSNLFIEPSAGVVWSRETVDPFNGANPVTGPGGFLPGNFSGTTQVNDIISVIGRVGLRVGTTIESDNVVFQPFAAASVWHDFGSDMTASYAACANCIFNRVVPDTLNANLTSNNIGTFGQYSVGVSGQVINTGWLGFVRVDYRLGPNMNGLSGTGGIRYQFTPTAGSTMPVVVPVKAKVKAPVLAEVPINWTGWYIGGIGGANSSGGIGGKSSMVFPGLSSADMRPAGFLGGGTLGYNYQVGQWVYGIEGDVSGTNAAASTQCTQLIAAAAVQLPLFQTTCHDSLDWIVTATARLGYTWAPHTLLYVKGGGAWANETFSLTCNLGPINGIQSPQNCTNPAGALVNQASVSDTPAGWTAGFGTEFALSQRWSAKAEIDWIDFGTRTLTMNDGTAFNASQRMVQGKIGINYKLTP